MAKAQDYGNAAAVNGATATTSLMDSFNKTSAVAMSKLDGMVTKIHVHGLGNSATNYGNANGGDGGKAYGGDGGKASGGDAKGANGGDGGKAYGGNGGDGGNGAHAHGGDADTGS
ncbi:hypothetical protein RZS08_47550, partial [Arthrospira platensis SPKY1]|nr:hypothetical protein [Arthrospira platensis SPKY1]